MSLKKLALAGAAASLLGFAGTAANAYVVVSINDVGSGAITSCNTSAAINAGNCGAGWVVANSNTALFFGNIGNFSVATQSSTTNTPGTASYGFVSTATNSVAWTAGATAGTNAGLTISATGVGFTQPLGSNVLFVGSQSGSASNLSAGDRLDSTFALNTNNSPAGFGNAMSCFNVMSASSSFNCPAQNSNPNTGAGPYAVRTFQLWTVGRDGSANGTSIAEVFGVPQPATLALVGLALVGAGAVSRRRRA